MIGFAMSPRGMQISAGLGEATAAGWSTTFQNISEFSEAARRSRRPSALISLGATTQGFPEIATLRSISAMADRLMASCERLRQSIADAKGACRHFLAPIPFRVRRSLVISLLRG